MSNIQIMTNIFLWDCFICQTVHIQDSLTHTHTNTHSLHSLIDSHALSSLLDSVALTRRERGILCNCKLPLPAFVSSGNSLSLREKQKERERERETQSRQEVATNNFAHFVSIFWLRSLVCQSGTHHWAARSAYRSCARSSLPAIFWGNARLRVYMHKL